MGRAHATYRRDGLMLNNIQKCLGMNRLHVGLHYGIWRHMGAGVVYHKFDTARYGLSFLVMVNVTYEYVHNYGLNTSPYI